MSRNASPMNETRVPLRAEIPYKGHFTLTAAATEMVYVFGGALHCYDGPGGCRKRGLFFSRIQPKKAIFCPLTTADSDAQPSGVAHMPALEISVSTSLAEILNEATLDFGNYTGKQRFAWTRIPALKTPPCTCLRSIGASSGKRSPCLDDQNLGFTDLKP